MSFLNERYLTPFIRKDLEEKMVLLSGPRQVGKTTLALRLLGGDETNPAYYNWDYPDDQKKPLNLEFPSGATRIVLDEIHKYKRWRNWLKGVYDKTKSHREYLVTGSARLDLYKRGGDALTGRYHSYILHPLSLREADSACSPSTVEPLLQFSGFPEPFFAQSEIGYRRWHRERTQQVLRDDLKDLERVEETVLIAQLAERLPDLIGSPLSINALREDLQVAHQTVQKWLVILEKLFVLFRVSPFGSAKIRAVKKEQKAYLWDWASVPDEGARFENMVASQLLKYCQLLEDTEGHNMELRYIRDTDKREIDFVVVQNGKPQFAVECQRSDKSVSPFIGYFAERLKIPRFYVVHLGQKDYAHAALPLRVLPFHKLVWELRLP